VVDEAYAPFVEASFMPRLGEYPKLGLAGCLLERLNALNSVQAWQNKMCAW